MAGQLEEVRVTEGQSVEKGQVLAIVDAKRESAEVAIAEANVELAKAKLDRVKAGSGQEEIREAEFAVQACEAMLKYETSKLGRSRKLHQQNSISIEDVERVEQQVEHLTKQRESLRQRHAALVRGPIPEEVAAAEAEVTLAEQRLRLARVKHDYRLVTAPTAGTVLVVYRHAGDSVSLEEHMPIVRMADATTLRVRLEIDEADVPLIRAGMEGDFQIRGVAKNVGRIRITAVIPEFGPKRLFNPDTSARMDTRILNVLCEIVSSDVKLYTGQRITAFIPVASVLGG
jgi:HlyD family secretion protein